MTDTLTKGRAPAHVRSSHYPGGDHPDHVSGDPAPAAYQAKDLLDVWNNFVSNLSPGQRKWLVLFYILAVCALLAVIVTFIYGAGYVVGQFLGHLMK